MSEEESGVALGPVEDTRFGFTPSAEQQTQLSELLCKHESTICKTPGETKLVEMEISEVIAPR